MFPGLVLTREDLSDVVRKLSQHDEFVLDVETVGDRRDNPVVNDVTWIALATHGFACSIPMGHPNGDDVIAPAARRKDPVTKKFVVHPAVYSPPPTQLPRELVFETLAPLFASDRRKIAHGAVFDLVSVAKYLGGPPAPPFACTITAAWVLDENRKSKALKDLVIGTYGVKYDLKHTGKAVEKYSISEVGFYGFMDARYDWLLWRQLRPAITAQGLDHVYEMECDLLEPLVAMRRRGAHVDEAALTELDRYLTAQIAQVKGALFAAAGREFNIDSTPQKQQLLYGPRGEGGLGLKPTNLTKGSRDAERAAREPRGNWANR